MDDDAPRDVLVQVSDEDIAQKARQEIAFFLVGTRDERQKQLEGYVRNIFGDEVEAFVRRRLESEIDAIISREVTPIIAPMIKRASKDMAARWDASTRFPDTNFTVRLEPSTSKRIGWTPISLTLKSVKESQIIAVGYYDPSVVTYIASLGKKIIPIEVTAYDVSRKGSATVSAPQFHSPKSSPMTMAFLVDIVEWAAQKTRSPRAPRESTT